MSLVKIKDEYRSKVDIDHLFSDLKALGIKYEQDILREEADQKDKSDKPKS